MEKHRNGELQQPSTPNSYKEIPAILPPKPLVLIGEAIIDPELEKKANKTRDRLIKELKINLDGPEQ